MTRAPDSNAATLAALILATAIGFILIIWAYTALPPWTGVAEVPPIGPNELAQLALRNVQYVQTLATAILGGAILVLNQRLLGGGSIPFDRWRRAFTAFGFLMVSLSLLVGFVNIEVLIEAADQQVVDEKMHAMRKLRILQSAFLLVGAITIGGTIIWDVIRGRGPITKE